MKRVVIIGSGNVAWALALAVSRAENLELVQIYARNIAAASELAQASGCGFTSVPEYLAAADLYVIAVSDLAVGSVSASLPFGDAVVAHTAGAVDMSVLNSKIVNGAVLYPLQTFTKGREVDFSDVPFLIEGRTEQALECVREVAQALSDSVHEVNSTRRARMHVAAVFACNFTNHMYVVAQQLLGDNNMSFDLLKPLILETAQKAVASPSPLDTQTGPAIRNDFKTKSMHCEMLLEKPDLKNIYITLSKNIWEISKKI